MFGSVAKLLRRFLSAREDARRFQKDAIGDVSPHRCFADFLTRIYSHDDAGIEKAYGVTRTKAALSVHASGISGGFLVPPELRYDLMIDVAESALIRPRATVVPMASATLDLSLPTATAVPSAGTAAFFGGILLNWAQEAVTRTETEPTFRNVTLAAKDLTGYALASNSLLADAGQPLDSFLRTLFARALAWYEDLSFLTGTGATRPLGILSSSGTISVSRSNASDFTLIDSAGMIAKLLPSSWPRAIWIMHPTVLVKLAQQSSSTTTVWQANMPTDSETYAGVGYLHGRPILVSEKVSTLGTAGDVMLIDPALYVIGDRQAIEIAVSRDQSTAFLNNQSAWRITARLDGQPWFNSAITLQNASSTVSPNVILS